MPRILGDWDAWLTFDRARDSLVIFDCLWVGHNHRPTPVPRFVVFFILHEVYKPNFIHWFFKEPPTFCSKSICKKKGSRLLTCLCSRTRVFICAYQLPWLLKLTVKFVCQWAVESGPERTAKATFGVLVKNRLGDNQSYIAKTAARQQAQSIVLSCALYKSLNEACKPFNR